jgi:hypothetical protein
MVEDRRVSVARTVAPLQRSRNRPGREQLRKKYDRSRPPSQRTVTRVFRLPYGSWHEQRAKLESVQVAEPIERLQGLQEGFSQGQFDFAPQLLAAANFLRAVGDSLQLRLFLEVPSHEQLPSERRIKSFPMERLSPLMERPAPVLIRPMGTAFIENVPPDSFLKKFHRFHKFFARSVRKYYASRG